MSDEYTPRRHLQGTLNNFQNRKRAVGTLISANQKANQTTIHYLQGYYDAMNLVCDEVRQAKDAEIMGISPTDE